ncbi:hypothetical protein [Robertmurraya massiliosenegalensis]|uniref:hypothetical protein n=1 Tax=Robertmurraya massiliosenegalensis TaxID=1287657 RepID=UPI0002DA77C8|nr:hypothetical protein [Robertmurraya massiliosenegalensis]
MIKPHQVDQNKVNRLWIIAFQIYSNILLIYTFYLFFTGGNGGIPFILLMLSYSIFFGSLRMFKLNKNKFIT